MWYHIVMYTDEIRSFEEPTLVVLGAGNTPEGPSDATIANANKAVDMIRKGYADSSVVFTIGYGPELNLDYPFTEAGMMATIIGQASYPNRVAPVVLPIEDPTDTYTSAESLKSLVTKDPDVGRLLGRIGLVTTPAHSGRAQLIFRDFFPDSEVIPVASDYSETLSERAVQATLRGLYKASSMRSGGDPEEANRLYRRVIGRTRDGVTGILKLSSY